jgi:hypothetical protein
MRLALGGRTSTAKASRRRLCDRHRLIDCQPATDTRLEDLRQVPELPWLRVRHGSKSTLRPTMTANFTAHLPGDRAAGSLPRRRFAASYAGPSYASKRRHVGRPLGGARLRYRLIARVSVAPRQTLAPDDEEASRVSRRGLRNSRKGAAPRVACERVACMESSGSGRDTARAMSQENVELDGR